MTEIAALHSPSCSSTPPHPQEIESSPNNQVQLHWGKSRSIWKGCQRLTNCDYKRTEQDQVVEETVGLQEVPP